MPRGRFGRSSATICLDCPANASQVAAIDVGIDVEHRRHIVVIDDDRAVAARHIDETRQELSGPARHRSRVAIRLRNAAWRRPDRRVSGRRHAGERPGRRLRDRARRRSHRRSQQLVQRVEAILRRLDADVVADAGRGIQPEARRHLIVAAERNQHAARHITLGQPHLTGLHAVDVQIQLRLLEDLVDVHIGRARDAGDPLLKTPRDLIVRSGVSARQSARRSGPAGRNSESDS